MADLKISQLTSATTPLGATDVLPVVQSSTTKKVAASTFAQVGQDNSFTASQTIAKTSASNTQVVLVSELDGGNDYQSALSVRRTGTAGGALWQSKRNTTTGGVGWVAKVTVDNAAEVAGTFSDAIEIDNDRNVKISTAAKGVNFTANTPAAGMTSQLLNWYEEGTWTPSVTVNSGTATSYTIERSVYTRIGRQVTVKTEIIPIGGTFGDGTGYCSVTGLPFQPSGNFIGSMGNTANYIKGEWSYAGTNSANLNIDIGAGITITVGNRATLQVTYFV